MKSLISIWNNEFFNSLPNVLVAVIILLIAFLVATLVKKAVSKILSLLKVEKLFEKAKLTKENSSKVNEFISKIVYLITFALFLPGIFDKLGLSGISEPIMSMMSIFLTYLPNIVAALVILVIGLFVAKLVRELLIPIFKKLRIDEWLVQLGLSQKEGTVTKSEILANIIYVLILIPVIIASLDALHIAAISDPAVDMLHRIFAMIPNILIAVIIFFVGKFISDLVFTIVENTLNSINADKLVDKMVNKENIKNNNFSLVKIIAYTTKYIVIVFFLVQALNILKLDVLTNIGNIIIGYLPYALSTLIIVGITLVLANLAEKAILNSFPNSKASSLIAKVAIIVVGVFISLYQLGIASNMVNAAFIIILSAIAVAFALSFGLGGREFASNMLKKLENKIDNNKK